LLLIYVYSGPLDLFFPLNVGLAFGPHDVSRKISRLEIDLKQVVCALYLAH